MKTHEELIPALLIMHNQGGGFASALAKAWLRADHGNSQKLQREFADLLAPYAALAERVADSVREP